MGLIKGGFERLFQTLLYGLTFCCAGIVLGIYSYFLSVEADRSITIPRWEKAVEGISGIAVVYSIFGIVFTCCLSGIGLFAALGLVLDVLFIGGFIALAVLTRDGASSCKGNVKTPLGSGSADSHDVGFGSGGFGFGDDDNATYEGTLGFTCRLNKAAFAVSVIGALLFLITALMQIAIARRHKKEKRLGPSPQNNYTSGPAKKRNFWNRKRNADLEKEAPLGAAGAGAPASTLAPGHDHTIRPSYETGSTVAAPMGHNNGAFAKETEQPIHHATHGHGAYHTAPTGTGAPNPYGYDNTTGTARNF